MTDRDRARTLGPVIQNLDKILDAHTHLSGSESGESAENILVIFDGRESSYCRPTFYEAVHQAPNFKGHLANVDWPWVDECIAVLKIGARFLRIDPAEWGLKVDLSFGPPGDWQLETWQRVLNNLPLDAPCYASDVFWPCEPEEYREKYLQP